MSAETLLLRDAAGLMRERARAADTDEARRPYGDPAFPPVPRAEWGGLVDNYLGGVIGIHCASWHPAVALAVADWLDYAADALEHLQRAGRQPALNGYTTRALAVARAYLGGVA